MGDMYRPSEHIARAALLQPRLWKDIRSFCVTCKHGQLEEKYGRATADSIAPLATVPFQSVWRWCAAWTTGTPANTLETCIVAATDAASDAQNQRRCQ